MLCIPVVSHKSATVIAVACVFNKDLSDKRYIKLFAVHYWLPRLLSKRVSTLILLISNYNAVK